MRGLLLGSQHNVRAWPNPGYGRLGVYSGGPDSYFDYELIKLSLGDTFPNKKAYWAGLKANETRGKSSHRHDIYIVYCGERAQALDTCRARVDAWLKPEASIPTYPELIPAICLGEENVGSRDAVLDVLARHIRETNGIPVFQFYSMPLSPNPDLAADGWVFDAYGMQDVAFRKHLMKFLALRTPVVCIPWASDPHWKGWARSETTEAMVNREWHQFPICMEFDVSCSVFAVAGPGAMNPWLNSKTKDMTERGTAGTACEVGKRVMTRPSVQKPQRREFAATPAGNRHAKSLALGTSSYRARGAIRTVGTSSFRVATCEIPPERLKPASSYPRPCRFQSIG